MKLKYAGIRENDELIQDMLRLYSVMESKDQDIIQMKEGIRAISEKSDSLNKVNLR